MHRNAAEFVPDHFTFAGMEARPDLNAQRPHGVPNCMGAPDSAGWAVEARKESVSRRVNLSATEPSELMPKRSVEALQEIPPLAVAQFRSPFRRGHDVNEEHGGEHSLGLGLLTHPGQEFLDLCQESLGVF